MLSPFSRVRLCATPWTAAYQAPLSMDFPGMEKFHSSPRTLIITYVQKQDYLVHRVGANSGIWPLDPSSGNMTSLQVPWGVGGGK